MGSVVPFRNSRLKLPVDLHKSGFIDELCTAHAVSFLNRFESLMLRPSEEVAALRSIKTSNTYVDPVLKDGEISTTC